MKSTNQKPVIAKTLKKVVNSMLSTSANSRCAFIYHQPQQPSEVKKFRKF